MKGVLGRDDYSNEMKQKMEEEGKKDEFEQSKRQVKRNNI